ncbi:hypothetical protein [Streptomyces sp. GQFP]|uniref:hypothetical protein n=1 Tax=Streptomyces sp. GQFP TaxID=2907545 RepID=UPI001F46D447|nr:hypothetical protein [Streptomyces sp. GQFP]UIX30621.1 hypothetical protein LUX31_11570 [Streptomyces sp. GQFP]
MVSRDQEQDGDVRELRRLLAVPAERDFPEGRRVQREEHLMRSLRTLAGQRTDGRGRRVGQRLAMGLAAAAVAAGVTVALPGGSDSGTESGKKAEKGTEQGTEKGTGTGNGKKTDVVPAGYALKKNANGTLTIYIKEVSIWRNGDAAHFKEMTAKIRAAGFNAVVENFPWDKVCGQDRGEVLMPEKTGDGDWDQRFVMTHADTYLVTVHEPEPGPKEPGQTQPTFYSDKFIKGPVKPCKSS